MLVFAPQTAIFIAIDPVDFRYGIDRLARCCRSRLSQDPMTGAVFVFRNRRQTAIKILTYDGQGFVLTHKRFSSGRLTWWPTGAEHSVAVPARELQVLLHNGSPEKANMAGDWRAVA